MYAGFTRKTEASYCNAQDSSFNEQMRSMEMVPRFSKKSKTELAVNKSLVNLQASRNVYQSPKFRRVPQALGSSGNMKERSPGMVKDKMKNYALQVKDP